MIIRSLAFSDNGNIPAKYTCQGKNINPPLEISDFPPGTKYLALIIEDPDAPNGVFDHLVVWNIPTNEPIDEGYLPGIYGTNSFGKPGYGGPCPPSGTHRYYFKAYAIDIELTLKAGANKKELQSAMDGHILASATLMGHYKKS